MLVQEQFTPKEIEGLQKCFVFYVKMPKSRWKDIKKAEESTPEGNKIFAELKEEYAENYLSPIEASTKKDSHNMAGLEYGIEHSG